ncbi:MAG TPA: ABC transporter permease [Ktedonobacterales bacterium]|nr:ABC transporter permease [Ktedonobacterales bacterium]
MTMLGQALQFIADPHNKFGQELLITLEMCAIPIVLSLLIAIPLGIAVAQQPVAAFLATNTSGLARAIPTIAFLAAAIPILGIGFRPSVLALTLLGIPPILLNTIAGLRGIDPATLDAGRGMGMTRRQILTGIEIPLVLPVVAAGVRSAAVQIVATSTLAALVGGGGLGDYVVAGIALGDAGALRLFVGAVSIAVLALLVEVALAYVQRRVTPMGLRSGAELAAPHAAPEPALVEAGTRAA